MTERRRRNGIAVTLFALLLVVSADQAGIIPTYHVGGSAFTHTH